MSKVSLLNSHSSAEDSLVMLSEPIGLTLQTYPLLMCSMLYDDSIGFAGQLVLLTA